MAGAQLCGTRCLHTHTITVTSGMFFILRTWNPHPRTLTPHPAAPRPRFRACGFVHCRSPCTCNPMCLPPRDGLCHSARCPRGARTRRQVSERPSLLRLRGLSPFSTPSCSRLWPSGTRWLWAWAPGRLCVPCCLVSPPGGGFPASDGSCHSPSQGPRAGLHSTRTIYEFPSRGVLRAGVPAGGLRSGGGVGGCLLVCICVPCRRGGVRPCRCARRPPGGSHVGSVFTGVSTRGQGAPRPVPPRACGVSCRWTTQDPHVCPAHTTPPGGGSQTTTQ